MDIEQVVQEKYPLCYAAGVDGNEFAEKELNDKIDALCNRHIENRYRVRQIEILRKLDNNEELTVDDINDCKLMQDLPGEKWRRCKNWTHYFVSNLGRVKSSGETQHDKIGRPYTFAARIMSLTEQHDGYLMVYLSGGKYIKKNHSVHRLVAEVWVPKTKLDRKLKRNTVNHKDANKHNNQAVNLEWTTDFENQMHARNLGLFDYEVVNTELARIVRDEYMAGEYKVDICRKHNISLANLNVMLYHDARWPDLPKVIEHERKSSKPCRRDVRKLTDDQVLELRVRLKHGEKYKNLVNMFNVSDSTIWALDTNKTYKNMLLEDHIEEVKTIEERLGYK